MSGLKEVAIHEPYTRREIRDLKSGALGSDPTKKVSYLAELLFRTLNQVPIIRT